MVHYELPRLPFDYDELEPYIDEQTMRIHHLEHQSYVDGLNATLEQICASSPLQYITSILSDLNSIPEPARSLVGFFGGSFESHKMFWETLTPESDGSPGGKLADALEIYFGGFEDFKKIFSFHAAAIQGSGWCWLVFNQTYDKIEVITTANHDSPWAVRKIPLLGLDLWEHAYYLQYQNKRTDYVKSWWNLVNWSYVEGKFSELA